MSDQFNRFAKNVFSRPSHNTHVWFSAEFEYELKKPREFNLENKNFTLIKDRLNESILDNWYFVRIIENRICVQQWVPFNQY